MAVMGREPLLVGNGPGLIKTVGWCTGAAQSYLEAAARRGLDAFISGEISEPTVHLAREYGLHYFAAGHHATERYGVQALGGHLAERFGIQHTFIDIDNPV
jgi:putative NIF3 family GTP cyclohydrolase 1 type 2